MGTLPNPRFRAGTDGAATGWEFSDNCAEALAAPACDTEPFPEPDGVISGRLGSGGKYDLGVNDFSDQSFTPVEGTYVRTLKCTDPLLVEADTAPIHTRVRLRHDAGAEEDIEYSAVLFVLPMDTGVEIIVDTIEITLGMDETVERVVEVAPFLGREIKVGWRLERVQGYISVPLTMGAPRGYWRLEALDGGLPGGNLLNEGTTAPGAQSSALPDTVLVADGNPHGGPCLHVPAPGSNAGFGVGLADNHTPDILTRSFWVRPLAASAGGTLLWWFYHITGFGEGYLTMGPAVDGKRDISTHYFWSNSGRTSTASALEVLNDDEWNNIFIVSKPATGTREVYVNGELVITMSTGFAEVIGGGTALNAGVRWDGSDEPNSYFWEMACWTSIGTAEDAFEVYYRGLNNIRLDALE